MTHSSWEDAVSSKLQLLSFFTWCGRNFLCFSSLQNVHLSPINICLSLSLPCCLSEPPGVFPRWRIVVSSCHLLLQTVNLGNNTSKVPRVLEILPLKVLNVGFSRIWYIAGLLKVENNHSHRPNPLVLYYEAYVQFCTLIYSGELIILIVLVNGLHSSNIHLATFNSLWWDSEHTTLKYGILAY